MAKSLTGLFMLLKERAARGNEFISFPGAMREPWFSHYRGVAQLASAYGWGP